MFRQLARALGDPAKVFLFHPVELIDFLETVWVFRKQGNFTQALEWPQPLINSYRTKINGESQFSFKDDYKQKFIDAKTKVTGVREQDNKNPEIEVIENTVDSTEDGNFYTNWHHLIYSYMIENTRVIEIFQKVLYEFLYGERLGYPISFGAQNWLRTTEELFFKDNHFFNIFSLTSHIRPDIRGLRRNAYYRMFGMDLNHGTDDNRPYPYYKPEVYNHDFVSTLEEFLREVWIGINFREVTTSAKESDDTAIKNHARRLQDMLTARRGGGNLSREEFFFVATMSWFHLTLDFESEIVIELRAQGPSPQEKLKKIGETIGISPHSLSESYFKMAEPISRLLRFIEDTWNSNQSNPAAIFYVEGKICNDIKEIITHWSVATGRDLKHSKPKTIGK